jgi:hypothetical protein
LECSSAVGAICLFTLAAGCRSEESTTASAASNLDEGTAGADSADTGCNVVLRHAERPFGEQGPVQIRDGKLVWSATVDVASSVIAQGATPKLHLLDPDPNAAPGTWIDVQATPAAAASNGFSRFTFEFLAFSPESSSIDIAGTVTFIPFVTLPGGARLFDHNRTIGNYSLSHDDLFAVLDDTSTCPAHP